MDNPGHCFVHQSNIITSSLITILKFNIPTNYIIRKIIVNHLFIYFCHPFFYFLFKLLTILQFSLKIYLLKKMGKKYKIYSAIWLLHPISVCLGRKCYGDAARFETENIVFYVLYKVCIMIWFHTK